MSVTIYIYIYICIPLYENVKREYIQQDIVLYKTSYIWVSSKTFFRLYVYFICLLITYVVIIKTSEKCDEAKVEQ